MQLLTLLRSPSIHPKYTQTGWAPALLQWNLAGLLCVIACEQALQGALAAAEQEKEGELATMPLEFEFHLQFPCGSPSTELSDFRQSTRSRNERECTNGHWKKRAKVNDVTTNVISANQHFASTFLMQIFKFQRRTCKLSFLFPPHRQSTPESLLENHVRHGDSDNENENGSKNEE